MTDKTPDQWTQQYMPSLSEWKGGFAADVTNSVAQAKTYTDNVVAPLASQVATDGSQLSATSSAVTTLQGQVAANTSGLATITSAAARNPATADQDWGGHLLRNLAQGILNTDAARLDQVGWRKVVLADSLAAGVSGIAYSLSGYAKIRLEWSALSGTTAAGTIVAQLSRDNGSTYDSGSNYSYSLFDTSSSSPTVGITGTYMPITLNRTGSQICDGWLEYSVAANHGLFQNVIRTTSVMAVTSGGLSYSQPSPTNIIIALSASAFSGGLVRMLGWKS